MKKCRQKDGGFWPLLTPYGSSAYRYLPIEIIDIECVLGNLAGTQIEKKIALINPPCWICPRSGLCEFQWGEFNLPL